HRRGARARAHGAALQPHPVRGRGAVRAGDDHPRRAHGRDRLAGRDAPPEPDHDRGRSGGRAPRRRTSRAGRAAGDRGAVRAGGCEGARKPSAHAGRAVPAPLRRRRARAGMTGVRTLLVLALKRDRVMIPAWVLLLGLAVGSVASSYESLYSDPASRRSVVQTLGTTPATLMLYGRIYADSVGGLVAWRLGGAALALAGLMTILIVVRHTRADEETGRSELVGSTVVGRHAPLAAALIAAALASVALGVIVVLGVVATGLGFSGAL